LFRPELRIRKFDFVYLRITISRIELGGTGLGLSIVKHLMIAHGGKMEIESQLGHGTKVFLFFPVTKG
jgi:two-component system phosphate regulon sensor histidine kinase PhoR